MVVKAVVVCSKLYKNGNVDNFEWFVQGYTLVLHGCTMVYLVGQACRRLYLVKAIQANQHCKLHLKYTCYCIVNMNDSRTHV
jgi:hypothetical protein